MSKLNLFDKKNVLSKIQEKSIIGGGNASAELYADTQMGQRYDIKASTAGDCESDLAYTKKRDDRWDGVGLVIDGEDWVAVADNSQVR